MLRSLSMRIVPRTHDFATKKTPEARSSLLMSVKGITMRNSMQFEKMTKRPLFLAVVAAFAVAGCSTTQPIAQSPAPTPSYVGPAGADGPTGPVGARGPTGATGATGAAMTGAAGPTGPVGPAGAQGPSGATGATGAMVVGRAGDVGPAGPAGAQGAAGQTGAQGSSLPGAAGPMGRAGPAGAQGVAGGTGAQGPTTVGPTGPTGRAGPAGAQGATGSAGAQGSTELGGITGPAGATGAAGPQGPIGPIGAQGPMAGNWKSYWDYTFNANSNEIVRSDSTKAKEIANYMDQNRSLRIGLDGSNERRVGVVRDALIKAGVPASKIQTGVFVDPQLRRDDRVAVLVSS
jgi:Collagen triple helix repeat (20 copies)